MKKHYEAVAKIIVKNVGVARGIECEEDGDAALDVLTCLTTDFCVMFEADNPNFDSEKFIEACQNKE